LKREWGHRVLGGRCGKMESPLKWEKSLSSQPRQGKKKNGRDGKLIRSHLFGEQGEKPTTRWVPAG